MPASNLDRLPSRWRPTPRPVAPQDYRAAAEARVPAFLWRYLEGAAGARQSFDNNRAALERITLRPRVLAGHPTASTETALLGRTWSLPIGLAPIGAGGMFARRGETLAAQAAQAVGVPYTLSTVGVCTTAEVSEAVGGAPFWFQLYVIRDRAARKTVLEEAARHGCDTLLFTVDMPVPGKRYDDLSPGGLADGSASAGLRRVLQAMGKPHWAVNVGLLGRPHLLGNVAPFLREGDTGLQDFFRWMGDNFDPTIDWSVLDEIRDQWPGRLVVKGIMDAEDARRAAAIGVDGLVVSNHGGRQAEASPGTATVLPGIAAAVRAEQPGTSILVDGGVRSGTDAFKMLALGADFVLVGRPWVYAVAAAGRDGLERWLDQAREELIAQMILTGVDSIAAIGESTLADR
ncbi:MAG: L-lactate dehydrogenase [Myxococcota bacterium]